MPAKNRADTDYQKTTPATGGEAVTPSDAAELTWISRAIWVGGAGNLCVVTVDGDTLTFSGVPAGTLLPIRAKQVRATNTTATLILSLT